MTTSRGCWRAPPPPATSWWSRTRSCPRPRAECATSPRWSRASAAVELAAEHGKDPRLVQVVLDETATLLRADHGVFVCETHHGLVCANAGVDRSNAPRGPRDPAARRPRRFGPRAARSPARAARRGDQRLLRPRLADGPGGRGDRSGGPATRGRLARADRPQRPRAGRDRPGGGRRRRGGRRPRPGEGRGPARGGDPRPGPPGDRGGRPGRRLAAPPRLPKTFSAERATGRTRRNNSSAP